MTVLEAISYSKLCSITEMSAEPSFTFRLVDISMCEMFPLVDYGVFCRLDDIKKYYKYIKCYGKARKCKKRSEFHRIYNTAYTEARLNKWLDDYTWFIPTKKLLSRKRPNRVIWSYERCRQIALRYKTLTDFSKENKIASAVCRNNGWLEDFYWLERKTGFDFKKIDNVYAYFFVDYNYVYIGRTINPTGRDYSHRKDERSSVFKFAREKGIEIPNMVILNSGISIEEGLFLEDFWCKKYKESGMLLLNKAKTGLKSGSLGSIGDGKLNYKCCYNEAKKYTTLKDFRKKSASAYHKALSEQWLNDYDWLIYERRQSGYWTYEMCYNEAKKYKTLKDFRKKSASAYDKALSEQWLNDYDWLIYGCVPNYWTYERCYEEAKKYSKLSVFIKKCGSVYNISRKNGWINDFYWLLKKDISPKKVLQFSMEGTLVKKFKGVREASRTLGISHGGIVGCCQGRHKSYKGFIWKYEE